MLEPAEVVETGGNSVEEASGEPYNLREAFELNLHLVAKSYGLDVGVTVDGNRLILESGDTFTTPIGSKRKFFNQGSGDCIVYITRRNDQPEAAVFS